MVLTHATGEVDLEVPRDRDATFEPMIVKKRQRRLGEVDEIVLSRYAEVKADRMIIRYVNDALRQAGLDPVNEGKARQLVIDAYEVDARGAASLTAFDHAIWLAKGNALVAEEDES